MSANMATPEYLFLEPREVATLTGIKGGYRGQTREQRQCAVLRKQKVPFFINAAGRPIVARAVIEGRPAPRTAQSWEPGIMAHG